MEVNGMCSQFSSRVFLAFASLLIFLGGASRAIAQSTPLAATLETNRGCAAPAVFDIGESITFRYSVSKTAQVTLRLRRPDGSTSFFLINQVVPGGMLQTIPGVIGNLIGERTLSLDAAAGAETVHLECTYTVRSSAAPLTATLETNRHCGPTALFDIGEPSEFRYSVSKTARVTLRLRRPDGSTSFFLIDQLVPGGSTFTIPGMIGNPPGERLLTLDAVAGAEAARAECTYTARAVGGGQLTLSLDIDKGCNSQYHVGERILVSYRASADASLSLFVQQDNGTTRAIFTNLPVRGGQTNSILGVVGSTLGGRTIILRAEGTAAADAMCRFTAIP
jgi:hypothetical protein